MCACVGIVSGRFCRDTMAAYSGFLPACPLHLTPAVSFHSSDQVDSLLYLVHGKVSMSRTISCPTWTWPSMVLVLSHSLISFLLFPYPHSIPFYFRLIIFYSFDCYSSSLFFYNSFCLRHSLSLYLSSLLSLFISVFYFVVIFLSVSECEWVCGCWVCGVVRWNL